MSATASQQKPAESGGYLRSDGSGNDEEVRAADAECGRGVTSRHRSIKGESRWLGLAHCQCLDHQFRPLGTRKRGFLGEEYAHSASTSAECLPHSHSRVYSVCTLAPAFARDRSIGGNASGLVCSVLSVCLLRFKQIESSYRRVHLSV